MNKMARELRWAIDGKGPRRFEVRNLFTVDSPRTTKGESDPHGDKDLMRPETFEETFSFGCRAFRQFIQYDRRRYDPTDTKQDRQQPHHRNFPGRQFCRLGGLLAYAPLTFGFARRLQDLDPSISIRYDYSLRRNIADAWVEEIEYLTEDDPDPDHDYVLDFDPFYDRAWTYEAPVEDIERHDVRFALLEDAVDVLSTNEVPPEAFDRFEDAFELTGKEVARSLLLDPTTYYNYSETRPCRGAPAALFAVYCIDPSLAAIATRGDIIPESCYETTVAHHDIIQSPASDV
jgi:hypothetical protein